MAEQRSIAKFVILMMGRSGSSYLTALLDSHPRILAKGEKLAGMKKPQKQRSWTERFFSEPPPSGVTAIGFKTKVKDIADKDAFAELLREQTVRILLLRRRNVVKMTISWLNAERLFQETGEWNLTKKEDPLPAPVIDPERFAHRLEQMEKATAALEQYGNGLGLPCHSLYYEDLLIDLDSALEKIFRFLDVESAPTQCELRKNTSDNLRDAIMNFDELRTRYVGTPYLEMFDEILDPSLSR